LREGKVRHHQTLWPGGAVSLAYRVTLSAGIGWLIGSAAMGLTMGSVARSASSILSASPTIEAALGRLGVRKATEGYFGLQFLLFAVFLTVLAASQIAAIRDEEATGRLDNLLVRPVTRAGWLAGRLLVSLGLILLVALGMGAATWLAASNQRVGISLTTLLSAGLNAAAPAVLVLGLGAAVFALRGSLAAPVAYAVVAWSFLINLLGSFIKGLDWIRDTSLFTHIALVPSAPPDWFAVLVLVLIGAVLAVVGVFGFERRDVEYA
jgi:ABC-2 type transport system permease protein